MALSRDCRTIVFPMTAKFIIRSAGVLVFALLMGMGTGARCAEGADAITGVWMVPERDAKVEIYRADDGLYYGKIIWLEEALDEHGQPRRDIHNKDPELARKPLIGLHVVSGFAYDTEADRWVGGEVYNSRNGKTYAGYMKLQEDGTLFLRGHVKGLKFLGKTNIWERTGP